MNNKLGMTRLARALAQPLKIKADYASVARRILVGLRVPLVLPAHVSEALLERGFTPDIGEDLSVYGYDRGRLCVCCMAPGRFSIEELYDYSKGSGPTLLYSGDADNEEHCAVMLKLIDSLPKK